jgi:hypothetical protein
MSEIEESMQMAVDTQQELLLRRNDRNDWRTTSIARLKKIKLGATARQVLGAGYHALALATDDLIELARPNCRAASFKPAKLMPQNR